MSDIIEETRLSEQAEQANQNVSQDTEATTVDTENSWKRRKQQQNRKPLRNR